MRRAGLKRKIVCRACTIFSISWCIRDGAGLLVPIDQLAPRDIVELIAGDLVPADSRRRPPRLDMTIYPYLPRAVVATTSAKAYMGLLSGAAS